MDMLHVGIWVGSLLCCTARELGRNLEWLQCNAQLWDTDTRPRNGTTQAMPGEARRGQASIHIAQCTAKRWRKMLGKIAALQEQGPDRRLPFPSPIGLI